MKINFLVIIILITNVYCQINRENFKKNVENLRNKSISNDEVIKGLKEALKIGTENATKQLSSLDAFNKNLQIRIPFPPDAKHVADRLRQIELGSKIDEFEVTLNRAAEQATKEALQIFVNSISQMTIADAKNILNGPENAATAYLQKTCSQQLSQAFSPHIERTLANTLATKYWKEITTQYNRLPGVRPINTNLVHYTTEKTLSGIFWAVALEEKKIRQDPAARTTDILKKVFG
jgi:predicted enzyme involved in methoxymalonyl-ACP biosynthesis